MIKTETLQMDRTEQQVGPRNSSLIKPILPVVVLDLPDEERTEQLVEAVITTVFERLAAQKERVAVLSNAHTEYNALQKKQTVGQKKIATKLVRDTAEKLLKNPQDINYAVGVWRRQEAGENHSQESQELFSERVKRDSLALIKEKWNDVKPEQLAGLVRIYADNPQAQDFAKEMLTSYFDRPKTRRQRINAYYTFVSSVVDLVGEDKAFNEGVRIGLYDTDILPKDPYLIEQNIFVSLPYTIFRSSSNGAKDLLSLPRNKDEEGDLRKSLIAEYAILTLSTMGSKDLEEALRKRNDFISTSADLQAMWEQAQGTAEEKLGSSGLVRQLHNAINAFADSIPALPRGPGNESSMIHDLFSDETNHLNRRFNTVFSENGSNSGTRAG